MRIIARFLPLLALLSILSACGDDPAGVGSIPSSISISPVSTTVLDAFGATLPLQATVRDQNGDPISGAEVEWLTLSATVATVTTTGTVTALSNGSAQIQAKVGSLQTSLQITVQQLATTLTVLSGNNQSSAVGTQLPQPLRLRASDRIGNSVAGATISLANSPGSGVLSNTSIVADANGVAQFTWTLGTATTVSHSVTAQIMGGHTPALPPAATVPVIFVATPLPGTPAALEKVAGDNLTATVGSLMPTLPTVRVVDSHGNPVSGISVAFQVVGGGGNITGSSVSSNAFGTASPTSWALGSAPAVNTLRATSVFIAPVEFTANGVTGPPGNLLVHAGNNQIAPVQTSVANAPAVRVSDALGNPIAGIPVSFAVTGGSGVVTGANSTTDVSGVARVGSWTVGPTGGVNQLTATVENLPSAVISATAVVIPAHVVVHAGNNQTATVSSALPVQPAVRVTTAEGHPAPGVVVAFVISGGGGAIANHLIATNLNGVAVPGNWNLGIIAGANALQASVIGLPVVVFGATGVAGPPATLQVHAGNNQSAATNTTVAVAPAVRLADQYGNGIAGQSIPFAVIAGGGSVNGATALTNANGVAAVASWTVGPLQGLNQLRATFAALAPVTFSATGTVTPTAMVIHAGAGQSATVASGVAVPPAVRVTDAGAQPVSGVVVTFAVTGGGGSIGQSQVTTGLDGVAAVSGWTLGTIAGANTLAASAAGVTSVVFGATGTAGAAASIAAYSGNNQSAVVNTSVLVPPAVIVRDSYTNPVSGVSVTFAVAGGGGSVSGAAAVTGSNGVATVGSWTVGGVAGTNTLSATASGGGISGNPFNFNANAVTQLSTYKIELVFLSSMSPAQQAAFTNAVARWESIIIGDLPDIPMNFGAGDCGSNSPAINQLVDDLIIYVTVAPIDGPNGILGQASPCRVRNSSWLPITGFMQFDSADMVLMESSGSLEDVILHEMGHVVGIGVLWSYKGFLQNPVSSANPAIDTHFNGPFAISAFNNIGGSSYLGAKVPVENSQGGAGTLNSHWREGVMQNELMTGFISVGGSNPLSLVTIRSLEDLGYVVNPAVADPFVLPGSGALLDFLPRLHLKGDVPNVPIRFGGGG